MKESGQELIHHCNRLCGEQIKRPTFDTHCRRLKSDIVNALTEGAACTIARTAETWRRLSKQCDSLFVFAQADGVSPTNNAAERSLPRAVIFRKLGFGTQSGSGSETLAVVMSVLETCRRRGRHALSWITDAVTRKQQNLPAPKLLPGT